MDHLGDERRWKQTADGVNEKKRIFSDSFGQRAEAAPRGMWVIQVKGDTDQNGGWEVKHIS
ncbi:hypothetical protein M407DRAFT_203578 [Tulasnella calospora MUT 4182]|uniref:Uncharacterized protein n=1 Tax=Tulasnella calospora MUT 4182 TaxID=1051891 RepID=A0A0C3QJ58_9AGAM|nr:hypothetical protein M407DRAFT_203578 [Tulasnella calospora MUT 4182]